MSDICARVLKVKVEIEKYFLLRMFTAVFVYDSESIREIKDSRVRVCRTDNFIDGTFAETRD